MASRASSCFFGRWRWRISDRWSHCAIKRPGEWGKLLGLDRIPEGRTLRAKLKLLCQDAGRAMRWNAALAKEWIARQNDAGLYFYCDGHGFRSTGTSSAAQLHGIGGACPASMCACATESRPRCHAIMWPASGCVCGPPPMDPGLIATLKQDVIPWLETLVAKTPEQERRLAEEARAQGSDRLRPRRLQSRVIRTTAPKAHCQPDLSSFRRTVSFCPCACYPACSAGWSSKLYRRPSSSGSYSSSPISNTSTRPSLLPNISSRCGTPNGSCTPRILLLPCSQNYMTLGGTAYPPSHILCVKRNGEAHPRFLSDRGSLRPSVGPRHSASGSLRSRSEIRLQQMPRSYPPFFSKT